MIENLAQWCAAIGTITVAVAAYITLFFGERIKDWLKGPKLDCEIKLHPPDCHRTITTLLNIVPVQSYPRELPLNQFYSYYYRFKIWNRGKTSAEKVEVILEEVLKKEGDNYIPIQSFSQDNLVWSTPENDGNSIKDRTYWEYISPDTSHYCNLGFIHDPIYEKQYQQYLGLPHIKVKNDDPIFTFSIYFRSSVPYWRLSAGFYRVKIKVGCRNAKTITKKYELIVTGKWCEDEKTMLDDGVSIKEIK